VANKSRITDDQIRFKHAQFKTYELNVHYLKPNELKEKAFLEGEMKSRKLTPLTSKEILGR